MADESEIELTDEVEFENYNENNSDEAMETFIETSDEIIKTSARVRTGGNLNLTNKLTKFFKISIVNFIFYKQNVLALYKTDFVMGIDMVRKR